MTMSRADCNGHDSMHHRHHQRSFSEATWICHVPGVLDFRVVCSKMACGLGSQDMFEILWLRPTGVSTRLLEVFDLKTLLSSWHRHVSECPSRD